MTFDSRTCCNPLQQNSNLHSPHFSTTKTSALCPEYIWEFRMTPRITRQYGLTHHSLPSSLYKIKETVFRVGLEHNCYVLFRLNRCTLSIYYWIEENHGQPCPSLPFTYCLLSSCSAFKYANPCGTSYVRT
jgi:hypothetical protein